MLELLKEWDTQAFLFINKTCGNAFFDVIMPIVRNGLTWIPLYLVLIFFLLRETLSVKKILVILSIIVLAIILGDSVLADWAKFSFKRLRPCYEPALKGIMQMRLDSCGGEYGFFSAHATNHFLLATIFSYIIGKGKVWVKWAFYGWATLIVFAQVYVGKHYPGDILAGAGVGLLLGLLVIKGVKYVEFGFTKKQ